MQTELIALLAGRRGHFQMESGYHSEQWFALDRLFEDRARLQPFTAELAQRLGRHGVDAVCGPVTGGAKLAEIIGYELGVENFFAERFEVAAATGLFPVKYRVPEKFRAQLRGKAVAIVDDAISAGSAVRGTYADLLECGAHPMAFGALFVFGEAAAQFADQKNAKLEAIARTSFSIWQPAECPLCRAGVAIERISDANPGRR